MSEDVRKNSLTDGVSRWGTPVCLTLVLGVFLLAFYLNNDAYVSGAAYESETVLSLEAQSRGEFRLSAFHARNALNAASDSAQILHAAVRVCALADALGDASTVLEYAPQAVKAGSGLPDSVYEEDLFKALDLLVLNQIRTGDLGAAEVFARHAVRLSADTQVLRRQELILAQTYLSSGRWAECDVLLTRLNRSFSKSEGGLYWRGVLLTGALRYACGRYAEAEQIALTALRSVTLPDTHPVLFEPLRLLAQSRYAKGELSAREYLPLLRGTLGAFERGSPAVLRYLILSASLENPAQGGGRFEVLDSAIRMQYSMNSRYRCELDEAKIWRFLNTDADGDSAEKSAVSLVNYWRRQSLRAGTDLPPLCCAYELQMRVAQKRGDKALVASCLRASAPLYARFKTLFEPESFQVQTESGAVQ